MNEEEKQKRFTKMLLKEISPLLDKLILLTPTSEIRNSMCDVSIYIKCIIKPITDIKNDKIKFK